MKIAIAGATGFVGRRLVERAIAANHQVLVLTRYPNKARQTFASINTTAIEIQAYTPTQPGAWQQCLSGCEGVVNLVGEPIADKRWTAEQKQLILDSRQLSTRLIVEAIAQANPKPTVLVNPSAIGYYGTSETACFEESSQPGQDFLASVCQAWEQEAERVKDSGTRLVILRFGIVLGKDGGALAKLLTPFRLFTGGPIGSGHQWFSWIHRDDLVDLILSALTQPHMEGVYNGTAPNPVRMNDLCHTLGAVMHRPSWLPVPGVALELLLGEGAKVVLEGQQVLPSRTLTAGFQYQYPTLQSALQSIL